MKKLLYIGGGSLLLVLTLISAAFFANPVTVSAHSVATTPAVKATKQAHKNAAPPLKQFVRNYSEQVVDQIAPQLHLSNSQLTQKLQSGESLVKIAKGQDIAATSLKTIIIKSTQTVVTQELKAGKIDQKHATLLDTRVNKHPFIVARVLHHYYHKK